MSRSIYLLFAFSICLLVSCKPYQLDTKSEDMQYTDFSSKQKKWQSKDGNIAYLDEGKGEVILLLHGIPTSGWLYRKLIDPLVKSGHRVIIPDMLGFGNSDSPDGYKTYSKEAHAQRILGLMNHLKIDRWHHVMHDAGGLWTWELAKIDPTKFSKLSILNTIIYKEGFTPPVKFRKGLFAKAVTGSYRSNTNLMLKMLFKNATDNCELSKADIEGYKTPLKSGKTKGIYKFFTKNTKEIPDYSSVLKSLNVPTQVIWGTHDDILHWQPQSGRVSRDLNIKPENIHLLEKNHFLQEEAVDELIKYLSNF